MRIYAFFDGEDRRHFASLSEAKREARRILALPECDYIEDFEIERIETGRITKARLLNILNSEGGQYALSTICVAVVRRRDGKAEDEA